MALNSNHEQTRAAIREKVQELMEDLGAEPVLDLTQSFISESPASLAEIESNWANQQIEELKRSAHSFKSLNQVYGLLEAAQLAADIEAACANSSLTAIPGMIEQLVSAWDRGAAELIEILKAEHGLEIASPK